MQENAHSRTAANDEDPNDSIWSEMLPVLQVAALRAQKDGVSYRDPPFLVGAAVLIRTNAELQIVVGSNYKPQPGSSPRLCAEEEALTYAKMSGAIEVIGIVVAAPYQPDDHSGEDLDGTLPPCVHCRRTWNTLVRNSDSVRRRTRFVSMRVEEGATVKMAASTIGEILQRFPH